MAPNPRHPMLTEDVVRHRLPNGLTILVKEEHSAPVVAISTWVKAGYFNETDDEVGISHVIEHMFFKGTRRRPRPDQIASEVKSLGGEINAGTYYDFTHYYFALPSAEFSRGLEIQSDALLDPLVDPVELARELEAIIQEEKRKRDNPAAFALEKLNELAYRVHRIRRWRIGEEAALRGFTRERLLDYFRRNYTPENLVLSVAGDVRAAQVIEEGTRCLGDLPRGVGPAAGSPPEPPQDDFRFTLLRGDLKRAHLVLAFPAPPLFHPDDLPNRILATVLGRGRSSRLFQEVKETRGCVESIGAGVETFADLGIFRITAETDPGRLEEAARAIGGVLLGILAAGPSDAEIGRARNAVESQYYHSQADVLGVATNLAYYEALGDYRLADDFVRRLKEVTPDAVREGAGRLLLPEHASLLAYVPSDKSAGLDEAAARACFARDARPLVPSMPSVPQPVAVAARRAAVPQGPRRFPLPGGATLLVEEIPRLPVTSVVLLFRGGRTHEQAADSGISRLDLAALSKGTRTRDAARIAAEMESYGCSLEKIFDDDYLGVSISILSRHLAGGVGLLFDLVRNPSFPAEEVERERRVQLSSIESLKDQAMGYAVTLLRQAAFPDHPYGLPSYGSPESVSALTPAALARWHHRLFRPDRMVVAVAGDQPAESVGELITRQMEGWAPEGPELPEAPDVPALAEISIRAESRRRNQTFQMIGFPSVSLASDEKYPLDLLQSCVSGLGGIFFEAVRGRRGLAYVVGASNMCKRLGGYFVAYLGTSPDKEEEARRILFDEIGRIRSEGIAEEEILRSRRYLVGTYPFALQTAAARALSYAAAEIQEKKMEEVLEYPARIGSVSHERVVEAARRTLTLERYALGVLRGE
ncbi:MAG TPA: pitrilysin family protein [Candidatus Polarisedimenticolia bacterium]|nr:pitrilysin family protein [Candidatus Polarisedimenticolia bacterium]